MAFQTRLPLASSEERTSTAVNDPVTPNPRRSGLTRNPETTTAQSHTHVIPGLTRNPVLIPLWIPDQCHLTGSVTSGMTYVRLFRPRCCMSFRAWPGIQSLSSHGSRINVTSRARRRPGWRILEPGVQRTQRAWTAGNTAVADTRSSLHACPPRNFRLASESRPGGI